MRAHALVHLFRHLLVAHTVLVMSGTHEEHEQSSNCCICKRAGCKFQLSSAS